MTGAMAKNLAWAALGALVLAAFGGCIDAANRCGDEMVLKGRGCIPDIDECLANPCAHGTCSQGEPGAYVCDCDFGWQGTDCSAPVDACTPANPCEHGGACTATGPGTFSCDCAAGWEGERCEMEKDGCDPDPCVHGTCTNLGLGDYRCDCQQGFTGKDCDAALNACEPNPCQNGGTCTPAGPGGFSCSCIAGYTGATCQTEAASCAANPCVHGTCSSGSPYTCGCDSGWTGDNCDLPTNPCTQTPSPCFNGANCTNPSSGQFTCQCLAGYSGSSCETNIDDCSPNPCQRGAACTDGVDSHTCDCPWDYQSTNCATRTSCGDSWDVIYRLRATYRVGNTPGSMGDESFSPQGTNASLPAFSDGSYASPFTAGAFPEGYVRLRFANYLDKPAAGTVQLVEYYLPLEFTTTKSVFIRNNLDQSAGLVGLVSGSIPAAPVVERPCQAVASGAVSGFQLTWSECDAVPTGLTSWKFSSAQASSGHSAGCLNDVSILGNATCVGGLCNFAPEGSLGDLNKTWDQQLKSFTFSTTDYKTAILSMPEVQVPNESGSSTTWLKFDSGTPVYSECKTAAELSCDEVAPSP